MLKCKMEDKIALIDSKIQLKLTGFESILKNIDMKFNSFEGFKEISILKSHRNNMFYINCLELRENQLKISHEYLKQEIIK